MRKLSISKLLTLLISSFSLVLGPAVHGGSIAPGSVAMDAISDYSNAQLSGVDHSDDNKYYLYCDEGGSTDGGQECNVLSHIIVGVKGQVHGTHLSKVWISNVGINSPAHGTISNVGTGFSDQANGTPATTNNLSGTLAELKSGQSHTFAGSAIGVTTGDDTAAGTDTTTAAGVHLGQFTADPTLCFNSGTTADMQSTHADPGTPAATSENLSTVAQITQSGHGANALFELTFWMPASFDRDTMGYANKFTVTYDENVESSTTAANASGCTTSG